MEYQSFGGVMIHRPGYIVWMMHGAIGLFLLGYGIREARRHYRRSLELYLAAVGLQLAGSVLLVTAL